MTMLSLCYRPVEETSCSVEYEKQLLNKEGFTQILYLHVEERWATYVLREFLATGKSSGSEPDENEIRALLQALSHVPTPNTGALLGTMAIADRGKKSFADWRRRALAEALAGLGWGKHKQRDGNMIQARYTAFRALADNFRATAVLEAEEDRQGRAPPQQLKTDDQVFLYDILRNPAQVANWVAGNARARLGEVNARAKDEDDPTANVEASAVAEAAEKWQRFRSLAPAGRGFYALEGDVLDTLHERVVVAAADLAAPCSALLEATCEKRVERGSKVLLELALDRDLRFLSPFPSDTDDMQTSYFFDKFLEGESTSAEEKSSEEKSSEEKKWKEEAVGFARRFLEGALVVSDDTTKAVGSPEDSERNLFEQVMAVLTKWDEVRSSLCCNKVV